MMNKFDKFNKIYNESIKKSLLNLIKSKQSIESSKNQTLNKVRQILKLGSIKTNEGTSSSIIGKYEGDFMIICFLTNNSISLKVFNKDDEKPISDLKTIQIKDSDDENEIIKKLDDQLVMLIGKKFTNAYRPIEKTFDTDFLFN